LRLGRRPRDAISKETDGKDRLSGRRQRPIFREAAQTDLDPDSHTSAKNQPSKPIVPLCPATLHHLLVVPGGNIVSAVSAGYE
jgi:hypothetical protein